MKKHNSPKMDSLFYTGLAIVCLPTIIIGFIVVLTVISDDTVKTEAPISIKTEEPIVERKIVYDTVRVEIPEIKPKRKKIVEDTLKIMKKDSSSIVVTQDPS